MILPTGVPLPQTIFPRSTTGTTKRYLIFADIVSQTPHQRVQFNRTPPGRDRAQPGDQPPGFFEPHPRAPREPLFSGKFLILFIPTHFFKTSLEPKKPPPLDMGSTGIFAKEAPKPPLIRGAIIKPRPLGELKPFFGGF